MQLTVCRKCVPRICDNPMGPRTIYATQSVVWYDGDLLVDEGGRYWPQYRNRSTKACSKCSLSPTASAAQESSRRAAGGLVIQCGTREGTLAVQRGNAQ